MMRKKQTFGEQIRKLRRLKDVTQSQLAKEMGHANPSFISQIETGKEQVSPALALKILQAIKTAHKFKLQQIREL